MLLKRNWMLCILISATVASTLFINTLAWPSSKKYEAELEKYAKLTEAISGGFYSSSRVLIRVGRHTFYDYREPRIGLAGLYVVAIHENEVLLQYHYNTYFLGGASLGFSQDISKLPFGTFVVVAAKGEPTRLFDEHGQKALYSIGAGTGLLNQKFRTSYLCIGVKGLARGKAIEKIGSEELRHIGEKAGEKINLVFPKKKKPQGFSRMPGRHEGLMFGDTEVIYYIPKNFDPGTAQYLFGIHGAGPWRRPGALNRIAQFRDIADKENLVIIAPAFTDVLNRKPDFRKDIKNGKFIDPKIVKDRRSFLTLLNKFNKDRSDLKLIEIFRFFNENLMRREKFHLYGHSGGGQFVIRFITFHPELIDKVAASSPGTFAFPRRDKDYPWGLKMDDLEKTFGPQIEADDLHLSDAELDQKMNQLLDLQLFLITGEEEKTGNHPNLAWQGMGTTNRTRNYLEAMREEDKRLKDKDIRSRSKPFRFELHVMPGVGHNSAAGAKKAIELLFPAKKRVQGYSIIPVYANFVATVNTSSSIVTPADSSQSSYLRTLQDYASRTKVVSGGHRHGNQVYIRVDDYTFFSGIPNGPATAGLYVVAIHNNVVRLQSHYNTFQKPRASGLLARHIHKLPYGTFVAIAAKDEPTNLFNEEAQMALYSIGAKKGLLNQESRTSYLCLGVKGLKRGQAIEKVGMQLLEHIGPDVDKPTKFTFPRRKKPALTAGIFQIYDPSVGQKEEWWINDHCFIRGRDGTWHMFGITGTSPRNPVLESKFAHATADNLTQVLWTKKSFPLEVDPKCGEIHLWAPHVILHDGTYYMFYCAGDIDPTKYRINLATSKNLEKWQRHPENPMVVDGFHARDPFVLKVGNEWVMYYTATSTPSGGDHIVAYQTSEDLIHWHNRRVAFRDTAKGTSGGPTESPTVVRRGQYYYLFIGPREEYAGTDVFRSENPFKWELKDKVAHIRAHAAEVVRDVDGKWYVSHCGIGLGGLYLAHLYWQDGMDDSDTSLPIPK